MDILEKQQRDYEKRIGIDKLVPIRFAVEEYLKDNPETDRIMFLRDTIAYLSNREFYSMRISKFPDRNELLLSSPLNPSLNHVELTIYYIDDEKSYGIVVKNLDTGDETVCDAENVIEAYSLISCFYRAANQDKNTACKISDLIRTLIN